MYLITGRVASICGAFAACRNFHIFVSVEWQTIFCTMLFYVSFYAALYTHVAANAALLHPRSCKCMSEISYISYMLVLPADQKLAFVSEIGVLYSMYTIDTFIIQLQLRFV